MPDNKLSHLDYLEDEIYNNSGVNFVVGERPDEDLLFVQDVYPEQFNSMMKELTQFTAKYHNQADLEKRELQARIDTLEYAKISPKFKIEERIEQLRLELEKYE